MALGTLGTNANNTLQSLIVSAADAAADVAAFNALIKNDLNVAHPQMPASFIKEGFLFVPNRGVLRLLPGDYVGVDAKGWPIVVSAYSIEAASDWTHT